MIHFTKEAWEHLYWQTADKATLGKINILIKDCVRSPFRGFGKPEPLKRNLAGFWSRLGVKKAVLRPEMSYILAGCPVISVDWLGPTPRRICGPALLGAAAI